MAGTNPGFDASEFRTGIRFVMDMAAPPLESEQATFGFASQLVYNKPTDDGNVPFDPNSTVTRVVLPPVKVPCAIKYFDSSGQMMTPFGDVTPSKIEVTLLDEDHEKVKGCEWCAVGGEKYMFKKTVPPSGLFDVGLYVLVFANENEV